MFNEKFTNDSECDVTNDSECDEKKKCNVTVICFYPPCFDTFGIDR